MDCGFYWLEIGKALGFGVGLFVPAYIANRYYLQNEKRRQVDFNLNNLKLLKSELDALSHTNKKVKQTCEILLDVSKANGELPLSKFPHTIPFVTIESILSNLILFPEQDSELLKGLIELKANLIATNESLDFIVIDELLRRNPVENRGESVEEYFDNIFQYLNYTDQLIYGLLGKIAVDK